MTFVDNKRDKERVFIVWTVLFDERFEDHRFFISLSFKFKIGSMAQPQKVLLEISLVSIGFMQHTCRKGLRLNLAQSFKAAHYQ